MELLANLVRGFTIQLVRQSRFWNLDGVIWWSLWSHICSVRLMMWLFLVLTVVCRHFLEQNDAIRYGTVKGKIINLKVLGIGDGLTVGRFKSLTGRRVANDPN